LALFFAIAKIEFVGAAKSKTKSDNLLNSAPNNLLLARGGGIGIDDNDEKSSDVLTILEENPEYVALGEDEFSGEEDDNWNDTSDDDDGLSESDDNDNGNDNDVKAKVSKKLKKARLKQKIKKKALERLQENRAKITIVLAVFAFRNELFQLLQKLAERHAPKNIVTDGLKLLLFVDFMRRIQHQTAGAGGKDPSHILKFIGQVSPLLGAVLEKTMNHNPAYIPPITQHFTFESLNEYYLKDGMALHKAIRTRHDGLQWPSSSTSSVCPAFASSKRDIGSKNATTNATTVARNNDDDRTVVVLDWTKLDTSITSLEVLRQQVAFLLSEYRSLAMPGEPVANNNTISSDKLLEGTTSSELPPPVPTLEVLVLLESPGGSVSEYGLAGQHLLRLRNEPGITLTICVDKVAASGGYMLCCTASPGQLFAAPFALLGSIGVIGTQINVNKLLNNWGIEPLEFRRGKYKAPIGFLGPVSKEAKHTTQTMIDQTHRAFKQHVANARPVLKDRIDEIGNGNVWLGVDAVDINLVDAIKTSDEYIEEKIRNGSRVFKMVQVFRSGFLLGPRTSNLYTAEYKRSVMNGHSSTPTLNDDIEGLIQKSGKLMARFPFRRIKSIFSKTMML